MNRFFCIYIYLSNIATLLITLLQITHTTACNPDEVTIGFKVDSLQAFLTLQGILFRGARTISIKHRQYNHVMQQLLVSARQAV